MIVIYCQHRDALTSAERRMVAGMRDLPGVLLVNALVVTGRRTREIDGIWVHPQGVAVIEAKGTAQRGEVVPHQNGSWTIGGETADFVSGANPLLQARTAAQTLRRTLSARQVDAGFLPAVVTLSGSGLTCEPQLVGDMAVIAVDDLPELPRLLENSEVGTDDVLTILAALDLGEDATPSPDDLEAEGFPAGTKLAAKKAEGTSARSRTEPRTSPTETGGKPNSRDRRRARRLADLENQAHSDWRGTHRRRIISSAIAVVAMVAYLPQLPPYTLANGLLTATVVAAYQVAVRKRKSGPRDSGPGALLLWLLTLLPVVGIGASLSWIAALPALQTAAWPFVMMLAILVAAGLGCSILVGRSAFIHPPAIVIERYDEKGRPTGAFMIAEANPTHFPNHDWRPADSENLDAS